MTSEWVDVDEWEDVEPQQKSATARFGRAGLQGTGAAVGTILGMASPIPGGAALGGGLGYAIGSMAGNVLEEQLGEKPYATLPEAAQEAYSATLEGMQGELVGAGIGAATGPVVRAGRKGLGAVRHTFRAERELADIIAGLERAGDAQSLQKAKLLKQQIPGLDYTYGMGTNNRGALAIERGAVESSAPGFEGLKDRTEAIYTGNQDAIRNKLQQTVQGAPQSFVGRLEKDLGKMDAGRAELAGKSARQAGEDFGGILAEAKKPVQATMAELEAQVPDYPINLRTTRKVIDDILGDKKLTKGQQQSVANFKRYFGERVSQVGESTHSVFGLRRTLDDEINRAFASDDKATGAKLLEVKKAIDADLAELGKLARTGNLKTYQGQVVSPDKLADELERNLIAIANAKGQSTPDVAGVIAEMQKRGIPSQQWQRVVGETDQSFSARVLKQAERLNIGVATKPVDEKRIAELATRNDEIRKILSEVEPGQDVGAAMNAYNRFASEEYFGRFDQDAITKATRGNLLPENVTKNFANVTGVMQLKRAVGDDKAARLMKTHYESDLGTLLGRKPSDEQMKAWLRDNGEVLSRLGLRKEFTEAVRQQMGYNRLQKIVGADVESVFETILGMGRREQRNTLAPIVNRVKNDQLALSGLKASFRDYYAKKLLVPQAAGREGFGQIAKTYEQLQPAMEVLFTPNERANMRLIMDAVEMTQRMTSKSVLGGSQTGEIVGSAKERIIGGRQSKLLSALMGIAVGGGAAASGNPWVGVIAGPAAAQAREKLVQVGDKKIRELFTKAMFEPEYAARLVAMTKGGNIDEKALADLAQLASKSVALSFGE